MRRRFFVEKFDGEFSDAARRSGASPGPRPARGSGQLYELSDGSSLWLARTENVGRDDVQFSLVEQLAAPGAAVHVELLLAIVKFDRFEWAIEKATELGVDAITPLAADRCEKGLVAASEKRAQRWSRILAESAQQARRMRIPSLAAAAKPRDAFQNSAAAKIDVVGARRRPAVARSAGTGRARADGRFGAQCCSGDRPGGRMDGRGICCGRGRRICGGRARRKYFANRDGGVRGTGGGAICVRGVSRQLTREALNISVSGIAGCGICVAELDDEKS